MALTLIDGLGIEVTGIAEILYSEYFFFQDSVQLGFGTQTINPSDTLSLSDAVVASPGITISPSDTLSLSDAEANQFYVSFLLSDTFTFLDGVGSGFGISDQLFLFDSILIRIGQKDFYSRSLSDSINLTDADKPGVFAPYVTAAGDTLSISDAVFANKLTPSLDALSLTDAATVTLTNLIITVSFSVGDTWQGFDGLEKSSRGRYLFGDMFSFQDTAAAVFGSSTDSYLRRYLNDVVQ